jgi:polygalacturonase
MILKKFFIPLVFILFGTRLYAKDYKAALFNIYADGTTLNTRSIQFAINYIHDHGGGRLVFDVGRYLTGSIKLKSNVTLYLKEGAVIVGSVNPLDYKKHNWTALIFGLNQQNIGVTGKGVIDGQGQLVARNVVNLVGKGLIEDPLVDGRAEAPSRPVLIYFYHCDSVKVKGITLKNSSSWTDLYDHCKWVDIDSIFVNSQAYWNNDGIDVADCQHVSITNSYVNSDDDGICLKSFDENNRCEDILIKNCTVRSSANGIKFGTASYGGFSDVRIINNRVYDTYRSAIALETVYGGVLKDVIVDSLDVVHTGNLIFLRIGERKKGKPGQLYNIKFDHIVAEIAAGKPDKEYSYEGPVEDQPRNVSPAIIIAGLPEHDITDIKFENINISHPGGGDRFYANVPLDSINGIPELADHYPEFSMFKELPGWAIFIRHAKNIKFFNASLKCRDKDFRVPVVLDDVDGARFESVKIDQPDRVNNYYKYHSENILIK